MSSDIQKTAVITGGSSGIGLAAARRLKSDGFHVVILDVQPPPEEFDFFMADIRSTPEIRGALSQIPRINVLVNNAGVYFEKYLEDTTDDELDRMVDINVKGSYKVTREAIGKLREVRGSIIFVASCLGLVPELTSPLYCATKAGLTMLTKCLAQQYADCGVRVNCVLPGPIDTPLLRAGFSSAEAEQRCAGRIPLRRIGKPEDIANMISFLAGGEADFITGGLFPVDGGVSSSSMYSK